MKKIYVFSLTTVLLMANPIFLISQTLSLDAFLGKEVSVHTQDEIEAGLDFPSFQEEAFTYMMLPLKEDSWINIREVNTSHALVNGPEHLWQVVSKEGRYKIQTHMHAMDETPFVYHPENLRSLGSPNVGIALKYNMK